jgi:hypothetical protein
MRALQPSLGFAQIVEAARALFSEGGLARGGKVDYFGVSGAIMWSPFIICFFMWVFFIGAI